MAGTIKFGPLRNLKDIPAPLADMSFDYDRDTEVTELASGGRSIYRAPTGFKTFDMSWAGGTAGLQDLMDMYSGEYGSGPFYMFDPRYANDNLLPTRWASTYQLAQCLNGWGKPEILPSNIPNKSGKALRVSRTSADSVGGSEVTAATVTVLVEPGRAVNISVVGGSTGGAGLRWRGISADGTASAPSYKWSSGEIIAEGHSYVAVALSFYVPPGSSLFVEYLNLTHRTPTGGALTGKGVGAVQFNDTLQGTLASAAVDRIGLTVGLTEVQDAPTPWL